MHTIRIVLVFLLLLGANNTWATKEKVAKHPTDSIQFSLLTCDPGKELYSLFGHTAIRYTNYNRGIDIVFNYGIFSFNTPNFMFRFALGETDYDLGISEFKYFLSEYEYYERTVWEQPLNLSSAEEEILINLLENNYKPQHRTYRYNFFYDNCATRPRDIIEESINGEIIYKTYIPKNNEPKTFRDIIHQFTQGYPWTQFGIDLCIGSEADRPISNQQMMFAPLYLMSFFSTAQIIEQGEARPLVTHMHKVVNAKQSTELTNSISPAFLPTPLQAALLVFALVAGVTIYGLKKRKGLWGVDLVLFSIAGLVGCVLAFLAIFSEHPAVDSNYLLLVFHPGQLLFLPFIIYYMRKGERSRYHFYNLVVLTFFILLFPLFPQRFDLAVVPLALCLLVRSASNLILTYKKKR